jgi:alkanesulfonate monooxygenase SsuD/methylene tetrahydromethanopterin reductase-like flavin-dependent oxidoreductase (luciferase family)
LAHDGPGPSHPFPGAIVEYGAHLPLADLGCGFSLSALHDYARAASALGYSWLCVNDHLTFARPWLDGPTALATVIEPSGELTLATTVSLPVIRGAAATAKTLTAIDVLSGGRLIAGVGPGSSSADYALAGIAFEDRWRHFDEALSTLRALVTGVPNSRDLRGDQPPMARLEPPSPQPGGTPVWVASWGSAAGLRRVARFGDGWIASAYNVTPDRFRECLSTLDQFTAADSAPLPNALATTWTYVSEHANEAEAMLTDVLAPLLHRPPDSLRHLPIGPAELCAQRLSDLESAGVERVLLWPLTDPVTQLEIIRDRVMPLVTA